MKCYKCGTENPEDAEKCSNCGAQLKIANGRIRIIQGTPMKWYIFLVSLLLPISAFSNIFDGISLIASPGVTSVDISGLGDVSREALEKLNIFSGICMIIIAVFMFYTVYVLRRLSKNSLMCIKTIYIANALVNAVNGGLMYYILGKQAIEAVLTLVSINVVVSAFMIFANTIYFNKRKHIFVN